MITLSGAHAFRRFSRQLSTDFHEILYRTFSSHVLTSVKLNAELQKIGHLTCSELKI